MFAADRSRRRQQEAATDQTVSSDQLRFSRRSDTRYVNHTGLNKVKPLCYSSDVYSLCVILATMHTNVTRWQTFSLACCSSGFGGRESTGDADDAAAAGARRTARTPNGPATQSHHCLDRQATHFSSEEHLSFLLRAKFPDLCFCSFQESECLFVSQASPDCRRTRRLWRAARQSAGRRRRPT